LLSLSLCLISAGSQEKVSGAVVVHSPGSSMSHNGQTRQQERVHREACPHPTRFTRVLGVVHVDSFSSAAGLVGRLVSRPGIRLVVDGSVSLQLSARSIGLFEAFYSSLKPVVVLAQEFEVCPSGKFAAGTTEIPFEFVLKANPGEELFDTYHGVYVNVQYNITANMTRGMMAKNLTKQREFVVELEADVAAHQREEKAKPFLFKVSPDSLQNVKESSKKKIPESVAWPRQASTARLLRPTPLQFFSWLTACALRFFLSE
jgi:hypothetical protein